MSLDPLTAPDWPPLSGQQPPTLEKKCQMPKCPDPQKRAEVPRAQKMSPCPGWGVEAHVAEPVAECGEDKLEQGGQPVDK